jgi:hypoxia up-regulated 1
VTTLRFEADYSSLLHFSSAECIVELEVIEDKIIEVPVPANETDAAAANATDSASDKDAPNDAPKDAGAKDKDAAAEKKEAAGSAADKEEQPAEKKEDGSDNAANATEAAAPVNKTVFVKKTIQIPRRKVFHVSWR